MRHENKQPIWAIPFEKRPKLCHSKSQTLSFLAATCLGRAVWSELGVSKHRLAQFLTTKAGGFKRGNSIWNRDIFFLPKHRAIDYTTVEHVNRSDNLRISGRFNSGNSHRVYLLSKLQIQFQQGNQSLVTRRLTEKEHLRKNSVNRTVKVTLLLLPPNWVVTKLWTISYQNRGHLI